MSQPPSRWAPDDERPLPELPFMRKIAEDVWDGYFVLIVWTLALGVLFVPAVLAGALAMPLGVLVTALTVAPGLAGLMAAAGKAARGSFMRLGDAARGMARLYKRSVALALPLAVAVILISTTADILRAFPERQEMVIAWALQWGLSLAIVVLHIYLFPILALYDTPLGKTVQLAMLMVGKFVWQTLALMVLGGVLLALTTLHPLVWLAVPGVWGVVVMNATWRMTKAWSIDK